MSQPELVLALALTFGALATALIARIASARTRAARAFVLAVPAVTTFAAFVIFGSDVRVNLTPSMPLGIYRLEAIPSSGFVRGMFVVACAPAEAGNLGRRRGYLGRGPCPGDTEPLLKVVAAVPGDDVAVSARGVVINGCVLPNSVPLALDRSRRRLTAWPSGRYHLAPNQLWLYADNPRSWDSRYWGPAAAASILARAVPLHVVPSFRSTSGEPDCGAARSAGPASSPDFKLDGDFRSRRRLASQPVQRFVRDYRACISIRIEPESQKNA
jgi:conjugative transfer signal peptidase TraF